MTGINLKNRVALVTGGGSGIGEGIATELARAGARIIVTGSREEAKLQAAAGALPGEGHVGMRAPVDDEDAIAALRAMVEERFGRLDILVNNAGTTRKVPHGDLDALDDDLIDQVFRVNWRGSFAMIRAMRALLEKGTDSLVVNISSIAGTSGTGSSVAYASSKAAVNMMTVTLARALAPKIRVVAVSPGYVDTAFLDRTPEQKEKSASASLIRGPVTPEQIGSAVVALAALFPMTTGAVIPVDGGRP
jgi:3-oxoacyl-[acyl-carrier protein] reductase